MFSRRFTASGIRPKARRIIIAGALGGAFILTACGGGGDDPASPSWSTPARLEAAAGEISRPTLAVDAQDDAMAVWVQSDGASERIYARRYVADGTLGETVALSDAGVQAMSPQIGVDGTGRFFAVWSQNDSGTMSIRWSYWSEKSGSWSAPGALVSGVPNAVDPKLAVDSDGTATAVWRQVDAGYNHSVHVCRFTAKGAGVPVELANIAANGFTGRVAVAAGSGGKAIAVWSAYPDDGSATTRVWAGDFDGIAWTTRTVDAGLGDAGSPAVAFDADGNAMVVWNEKTGDETAATSYFVRSRRFLAASGWDAGHETLANGGAGNGDSPTVAFDSGGAVLVWEVDSGAAVAVKFSRYTAGSGWAAPVSIDRGDGTNFGPALTVDGNDNITVAWQRTTDYDTYTLEANRYEPAAGWLGVATVSAADQGDVGDVSIASDSRGRAIAVWEQENAAGTSTNAWFSVYQ